MFFRDPLFLPDLDSFFQEYQRNPSKIRLVSVEADFDPMADQFWSHQSLHAVLSPIARVLRIKTQRQQRLLREFHSHYQVSVFPSLYVFSPFSESPSSVIAGTFPDPDEFSAVILSLAPPPAAGEPRYGEMPQRRQPPPIEPDRPVGYVKVTLTTLNGETFVKSFKDDLNGAMVYVWASQNTRLPFSRYDLVIQPSGEILGISADVKLRRFAPELAVQLVVKQPPTLPGGPEPPKPAPEALGPRRIKRPDWIVRILAYLKDLSFIGDARGDPIDFWRPYSTV
jgi:hypothetical protein